MISVPEEKQDCIICLTDVSFNDYITLECCNKVTHITCINDWISKNIDTNTDIDKCFHCKKENEIITNIIYNIKNKKKQIPDIENNFFDIEGLLITTDDHIIRNNNSMINSRTGERYPEDVICFRVCIRCFLFFITMMAFMIYFDLASHY